MKTIEYVDFERKIKELNPDIHFDETTLFKYPYDPDGRTGIMLHEKHICNVSRGTMREEDAVGRPGYYIDICDADEALQVHNRDSGRYTTNFHQLTPDVTSIWAEVNMKLKGCDRGIIWLGGIQVTAERFMGHTADGRMIHNILIRTYTKRMLLPSTITRIGWRNVLRRLIVARIPGLTRQALEEAFGVELGVGKKAGKSFEEIVAEVI